MMPSRPFPRVARLQTPVILVRLAWCGYTPDSPRKDNLTDGES
jgi:hypothetical protein